MADEKTREKPETGAEAPAPPRSWMTPYLLMMLRSWQGYGYELVRHLALFGFGWVDPASVYRALRELEQQGCVVSSWDTSGGNGPARRIYTITDAGIEALGMWANTLDSYRQMLDRFFQQYNGASPPPGPGTSKMEDNSTKGE